MNLDSANGTTEDIWDGGGTYPYPTTAAITTISTASNSAPLQGADVEVIGLDTNWDIVTETVTLDAGDTTTLTAITTALKRVFSIRLLENVVAAVDIKLTDVSGLTTYCIITAGFNKSQMAMYTIPSGYTGYITNWSADYAKSVSKNPYSVEYGIWFADRENGYEFYLSQKAGIQDGAGPMQHIVQPYKKVTEKTDIKITSNANGAAAHIHAGFDLVLVENA